MKEWWRRKDERIPKDIRRNRRCNKIPDDKWWIRNQSRDYPWILEDDINEKPQTATDEQEEADEKL